MPQFDPRLISLMKHVLEGVMSKVPMEHATPAAKASLNAFSRPPPRGTQPTTSWCPGQPIKFMWSLFT